MNNKLNSYYFIRRVILILDYYGLNNSPTDALKIVLTDKKLSQRLQLLYPL